MYEFLLIWNFIIFCVYGIDKYKAKKKLMRIPQAALIIFAFLLGGIGAMFGMVVFNHKTSKMIFRILVPLAALLNTIIIVMDYALVV